MKYYKLILMLSLFCCQGVFANDEKIYVEQAWVREAPPTSTINAAYLHIENLTDQKLALISAESPDFDKVEIHKTILEEEVARMIPVTQVTIPPHETIVLAPTGLHFMLLGRKRPLLVGDEITLVLHFAPSFSHSLTVPVKQQTENDDHHHHH